MRSNRYAEMQRAKETVRAMQEETDTRIAAVLTPGQAQKFEKIRAERKEKTEKKRRQGDEKQEAGCPGTGMPCGKPH